MDAIYDLIKEAHENAEICMIYTESMIEPEYFIGYVIKMYPDSILMNQLLQADGELVEVKRAIPLDGIFTVKSPYVGENSYYKKVNEYLDKKDFVENSISQEDKEDLEEAKQKHISRVKKHIYGIKPVKKDSAIKNNSKRKIIKNK